LTPFNRAPHRTHSKTEECLALIEARLDMLDDRIALLYDVLTDRSTRTMSLIEDVQTAVETTGADAQSAADRVLAAIAAAVEASAAQIADLQAQVQALIDGNLGDVTTEQLQGVLDGLNAADATIRGIAPDAPPADEPAS